MAGCTYEDCTIQEVSIASLAGPKRRTKYFYRHTKTTVTPIQADGKLDADREFTIVHTNPGDVAPEIVKLVADANAALGTSLDELLNTTREGDGTSTHVFGCADECDCEKKKTTLPDGKEVDYPVQEFKSGLPKSARAVPGDDHPMVVIEKRVNIKGKGLHLLTYEVRIYGTVRRYAGRCVERKDEDEAEKEVGMGGAADVERVAELEAGAGGEAGDGPRSELGGGVGPVGGEAVGFDDRGGGGPFSRPVVIAGIVLVAACCCLAALCAAVYFFFRIDSGVVVVSDEPPLVVTVPGDDPSIGTEEPAAGEGTPTLTPSPVPTATPEPAVIITETVEIEPVTDTPEPTVTPEKDLLVFAGYLAAQILHGTNESDIVAGMLVLGADPEPVEGAVVALSMVRPDGSAVELEGVTDAEGRVQITFDIFVFGNYLITVEDIAADGYVYDPDLNLSSEFVVEVGSAEDVTVPADRILAFYELFNAAMQEGDAEFLFDALHPVVLERYGEEACRAWLGDVVQAAQTVDVLGVFDFGVWTFTRDEVSADVENAYSFTALVTLADGTSQEIEAHVALRDDASIGWFTDCGEPLE